jgi:hypothetical protein
MLKANSRYTAEDILKEAGIEDTDAMFGSFRVTIGGISGIVDSEHLISIPESATELEVIVGVKRYTLPLEPNEVEAAISQHAQAVLVYQGEVATEQAEELQKAKALVRAGTTAETES